MKYFLILALLVSFIAGCTSVKYSDATHEDAYLADVALPQSIELPDDGTPPLTGAGPIDKPTITLTFNNYNEKQFVKTGQTANFIYEGIDPRITYMIYESTDGGYYLSLHESDKPIQIHFTRMCQSFIVPNPALTMISFIEKVRYEQIIWTPREEGNWEVRIGSTERGCKSDALSRIKNLRTKEYESEVKSTIIK